MTDDVCSPNLLGAFWKVKGGFLMREAYSYMHANIHSFIHSYIDSFIHINIHSYMHHANIHVRSFDLQLFPKAHDIIPMLLIS